MVRKRARIEPTDDFQQILPLCWWPEQVEYELIRQPVLFGYPVPERAVCVCELSTEVLTSLAEAA